MKICPNNPKHKEFMTTAHEMHDWKVNGNGDFIDDMGCIEVSAKPNIDNIWTCTSCGAEAVEAAEMKKEGVPA